MKCNWSESVYKNTFFDKVHLDLETVLIFCNIYVRECYSYTFVRGELKLSDPSICDWASFCREVLVEWCVKQEGKIGGEGTVVEIDESKFGKRKYNVGRVIEGQWVFGGLCRDTRSCFMVPVEKRDSDTLLRIIEEKIHPGTTIISDCWRAYNCLSERGYEHLTVNHSINFVDPDTGASTQNIERVWRDVRRDIPTFGRRQHHFVGYLSFALFKKVFPEAQQRFCHFLLAAADLYPPPD